MKSPFPASVCACASLRRASCAVSPLYDLVLAPVRLKATQYIILQVIGHAGEIAHCDLARLFVASEANFSRRLASARAAGWLGMKVGNRYRRVYCLTDEGRRILELPTPCWERAQERMRSEPGEAEWAMLAEFAERVTQSAIRAELAPRRNGRPVSAA
jgi:DNA-binding MarR family transcriptional regulator